MTDFILKNLSKDPEELKKIRPIFNIFGDFPENVGPFIAKKILANKKTNVRISCLTPLKILGRMLSSPFNKSDIFRDLQ